MGVEMLGQSIKARRIICVSAVADTKIERASSICIVEAERSVLMGILHMGPTGAHVNY